MIDATRRFRVRAPELVGRNWLNTDNERLTLADFRGKIVLLDFWTLCCINCLHVIDELRPLEAKYRDELVVIGVHSPKFAHERDEKALQDAVERYGIDHPILDDVDLTMWNAYAAKAWPTLNVIDPDGYVIASMAGEGHAHALDQIIGNLVAEHRAAGTLNTKSLSSYKRDRDLSKLRFPGKATLGADQRLLVSDSTNHRIVQLDSDRENFTLRIGSGERGHADGSFSDAQFNEPQGICALPPEIAQQVGYDVIVADTVNHRLRGLNMSQRTVATVAGTGRAWRSEVDFVPHDAVAADLSSPWDVAWFDKRVIIAMAGIHQLWWFDPVTSTTGVYAGTTVEGLKDGPATEAFLAQPSGLAADGDRLWFVDSETSALRYVNNDTVHTVIGKGLFDFGHIDGSASQALLQHPLGVAVDSHGSVLIADTYNGAIRKLDPDSSVVSTIVTGLAEPSDIINVDSNMLVVESAAHRIDAPRIVENSVNGTAQQVVRPSTRVQPGTLTLSIDFAAANGEKLDDSFGPATRLTVTADPPELLTSGDGSGTDLIRDIVIADGIDNGVLQVVAQAATCDAEGESPTCHLTRQDWGIPLVVTDDGDSTLALPLRAGSLP